MAAQMDVCYFDLLPNEVLLSIICLLDVTSRISLGMTCSRHYSLVRDPLIWTHIIWNRSSKITDDKYIRMALKWSRSQLVVLSMSSLGNPFFFSKVIHLVEACQGLRKIDLKGIKLTAGQIRKILQLPLLCELYLEPEVYVPLVFKEISSVVTALKVFGYVETKCYYKRLLHDWSNANFKPSCVKVLLLHNSNMIYNAIKEICSMQLLTFPTNNNSANLYFYQQLNNTFLAPWNLAFHLQFHQKNGAVVNFQESNEFFCKKLVIGEISFVSGECVAIYEPNFVVSNLVPLDVKNACITSFLTLHHRNLSFIELHGIATNFQNLVTLDMKFTSNEFLDSVLIIITLCTKLCTVSFDVLGSSNEQINSSLWKLMGNLTNLTTLKFSSNLIPLESDPVHLSSLECFHITGHVTDTNRLIDRHFYQFTSMPALKSFTFLNVPPITLFSGFSAFLKSVQLSYFRMDKIPGNKVTFPPDYICYKFLKEMHIDCSDFFFSEHLGSAICRSRELNVLCLKICSIEFLVIRAIFDGLRSMMVYHVTVSSDCVFQSNKQASALSKSLMKLAKSQKRNIDIVLQKI